MIKFTKIIICFSYLTILTSCGFKSYKTFEPVTDNKIIIDDSGIRCEYNSVIYDVGNDLSFNLWFTTLKQPYEIVDIKNNIYFIIKNKLLKSKMFLESNNIGISDTTDKNIDSVFHDNDTVTLKFKQVDINSRLRYSQSYYDTTSNKMANNIDEIIFKLQIEIKKNGENKIYKEELKFKAKKHTYFWFIRDG